ncbi:MAG: hypothetical protein KA818_09540 [Methanoculleus sp.]|jgi:hypothetical protein|nr:hypothetical protein [Methanoculleus sp.]
MPRLPLQAIAIAAVAAPAPVDADAEPGVRPGARFVHRFRIVGPYPVLVSNTARRCPPMRPSEAGGEGVSAGYARALAP